MNRRKFLARMGATLYSPELFGASSERDAPRIALVAGLADYAFAPLRNCLRDANSVSEALTRMGFEVVKIENGTRSQLLLGVEKLAARLGGERATAVLYYAGHGIQIDWRNYLVPIDASIASVDDVLTSGVAVHAILESFEKAGAETKIVILDACRTNPYSSGATTRGLAGTDAPSGTFLAYATAPGNVADDGAADHGLYTEALLYEFERSNNVRIEDVFKRVRLRVRLASEGRQIPWESSSLEADFFFSRTATPITNAGENDEEEFNRELVEWRRSEAANSPAAWAAYIDAFPTGYFVQAAQFRLDHLQTPRATPQPSPYAEKSIVRGMLPAGQNRFNLGDVLLWERMDNYTGVISRIEWTVTGLQDHKVIMNDGGVVIDQTGNVVQDFAGHKFEPIQCFIPSQFEVGKKWETAYLDTDTKGTFTAYFFWRLNVAARERITLPSGTIDTFRIEARGFRHGSSYERTSWIDTRTSLELKYVLREHRYANSHVQGAGNWYTFTLIEHRPSLEGGLLRPVP